MELIVVIAIVLILLAVSVWSLQFMQERVLLNTLQSSLVFNLEEAKAKAVAGKNGLPHGIYFTENSYVQFSGYEYDPEDVNNVVHDIDSRLLLSTDILGNEEVIIFSRITGSASDEAIIEISSRANPENRKVIKIGQGGGITSQ